MVGAADIHVDARKNVKDAELAARQERFANAVIAQVDSIDITPVYRGADVDSRKTAKTFEEQVKRRIKEAKEATQFTGSLPRNLKAAIGLSVQNKLVEAENRQRAGDPVVNLEDARKVLYKYVPQSIGGHAGASANMMDRVHEEPLDERVQREHDRANKAEHDRRDFARMTVQELTRQRERGEDPFEGVSPGDRKRTFKKIWRNDVRVSESALKTLEHFDPSDKSRPIDGSKFNQPTISKLAALGYRVVNTRGDKVEAGGYSQGELARGRPSSGSTEGQARFERSRPLFFKRRRHVRGPGGKLETVEQDPRFQIRNLPGAVSDGTVGVLRDSMRAKAAARESKKLQNASYRAGKLLGIRQQEWLDQKEGELRESFGLRSFYIASQLRLARVWWFHKKVLGIVLALAIIFAPILGIGEWAGWAIGSGAITLLKFVMAVLVNVYNVIASAAISLVNLVGNVVSGGLEHVTQKVLDFWGQPNVVCTGSGAAQKCEERIYSYTVAKADTSFVSLPPVPQPKAFDLRPGLEIILGLAGIKWDGISQVYRFLFHWRAP